MADFTYLLLIECKATYKGIWHVFYLFCQRILVLQKNLGIHLDLVHPLLQPTHVGQVGLEDPCLGQSQICHHLQDDLWGLGSLVKIVTKYINNSN